MSTISLYEYYLSFELGTELGTELETELGTHISIRYICTDWLFLSSGERKTSCVPVTVARSESISRKCP